MVSLNFSSVPQRFFVGKRALLDHDAMMKFFDTAFADAAAVMAAAEADLGASASYYFPAAAELFDVFSGFEIPEHKLDDVLDRAATVDVEVYEFTPGEVASWTYEGSYDGLGQAWEEFQQAVSQHFAKNGASTPQHRLSWENYVSMPTEDNPEAPTLTELNWALDETNPKKVSADSPEVEAAGD
ncbi:hypothetical protein P4N68_01960 [Corynebacterium felinum]|uniref:Bacterial transcription activator, effector binding domain n=1 Tax=Corynebacterium felinum TaxID=131318 RepID=A0ABU2BBM4_9CORY|nr:hypothetical protein [Corynebacterium felinum]MDF5819846.1 hypothetical protein [Corynebacterium felinum]MDR7356011.1 hypothetical protein [Corynebacterium felinum]WJY95346.1 Bacterial transcription activator, effector binding domain [Corynebacterium felinum]